jgi:hypothetical protein
VLIGRGEPGNSLHALIAGRVAVLSEHTSLVTPILLAEVGAGMMVGGLGPNRSVGAPTITALEPTYTLEFDTELLALAETHCRESSPRCELHERVDGIEGVDRRLMREVLRARLNILPGGRDTLDGP